MKNAVYALLLGTSLLSCNKPTETKPDGSKVLYIPAECKDIKTLTWESHYGWSLTCKDEKGKEFHYMQNGDLKHWEKYEIVRQ